MREGFHKGTYFARHLEDALGFGGRHVFMVEFYVTPGFRRWQVSLSHRLPPSAIVSYHVYTVRHVKGQRMGVYNEIEHPNKPRKRYGP